MAEIAAVLVLVAAAAGPWWLAAAAPVGLVAVLIVFVRLRGRWVYEWLALGGAYATRQRVRDLHQLVVPLQIDGTTAGVVETTEGLTALIDLDDTGELLGTGDPVAPPPVGLLAPTGADQPTVRLQLILAGQAAPAPRAAPGAPVTSYRQLADGRVPAQVRVLFAVQVRRSGDFEEEDLHRTLRAAVRRIRRRLPGARILDPDAVPATLAELAHGPFPVRETWTAVEAGGLRQVTFAVKRWPDPRHELSGALLGRLLALPSCATTVAFTVAQGATDGRHEADLTVRLAATSDAALSVAAGALDQLLQATGTAAQRLDGAHLAGLAATLPLARATPRPVSLHAVAALQLPAGRAGLVLGSDRAGEPLTVRLFRPVPTRAVLAGGRPVAMLLALRCLALGATVTVHTEEPQRWTPFTRAVGDAVALVPPAHPVGVAGTAPLRPHLAIADRVAMAVPTQPWQASLTLTAASSPADLSVLAQADLALLHAVAPERAAAVGSALGLGATADWLSRVGPDMLAVVAQRRTLRWAVIPMTPIEQQLVGPLV